MTVGNVLLPAVVKREFPARAGTVTGMYTGALAGGAALTVALTAPVAAGWGWRWGLSVWALLAAGAAVVWVVAVRPRAAPLEQPLAAPAVPAVRVWREPVAWAVSAVLAMQSVLYYAVTAWLPSLLGDELGLGLGAAAAAATVFQVLGIPGALVVAPLLGRWRGQSGLAVAVAVSLGRRPGRAAAVAGGLAGLGGRRRAGAGRGHLPRVRPRGAPVGRRLRRPADVEHVAARRVLGGRGLAPGRRLALRRQRRVDAAVDRAAGRLRGLRRGGDRGRAPGCRRGGILPWGGSPVSSARDGGHAREDSPDRGRQGT